MRLLTPQLQDELKSAENFSYCFEITLKHGEKFFLTSSDKPQNIEGQIYFINCGLNLKEAKFDDSAKNEIALEGIFDEQFISRSVDLTGARVKISLYIRPPAKLASEEQGLRACDAENRSVHMVREDLSIGVTTQLPSEVEFSKRSINEHLYHFITYTCMIYAKNDLNFTIYLAPETTKYDKSLLNMFSKTCRADFGDAKCKIDKDAHKEIAQILNIDLNILKIDTSQFKIRYENGYFNGGDAIIGGVFRSKIYRHFDDIIEVNDIVPSSIKHHKTIELITGCDKNFITCCNKFNNAVNFRGEPYIKDNNFL